MTNVVITPDNKVQITIERSFDNDEQMLEAINDLRELQRLASKPETTDENP